MLREGYHRVRALVAQVTTYDTRIAQLYQQHATCQRLTQVPGVGPLTATAFFAAIRDAHTFDNGRQVAAWLGVVPKQHSRGGKTVLLGLSKRGDRYLRTLLIHGARTVVHRAAKKHDSHSVWIQRLHTRRGPNVTTVAVADKNARILWALLATESAYRPPGAMLHIPLDRQEEQVA